MPDFRCTFFFKYFQNGWSETLYRVADDAATAMTELTNLRFTRRGCLNDQCYITHQRVCNVDSQRDAHFLSLAGDTGRGTAGDPARGFAEAASEEVYDAVNLRMFAGSTTWRNYLIRGLPTEAFDLNGRLKNGSAFTGALAIYAGRITLGWAIRKLTHGDPVVLSSITQANQKLLAFATAPVIPAGAANMVIRIDGAQGVSNLNGTWRVRAPGNASPYSVFPKTLTQLGTYTADSGRVRKVTYTLAGITTSALVGNTTRRTGRPSYLPRGKRSVRRS